MKKFFSLLTTLVMVVGMCVTTTGCNNSKTNSTSSIDSDANETDYIYSVPVSLGDSHSAAIKEDGSFYVWGYNYSGQLGNGTTTDSHVPIKIMDNVKSVSLGDAYSAAIKEDGSLWMWGYNRYGQLGNATNEDSNLPIKIMGNLKCVSLGGAHSAAIKNDGSLWMWGSNSCGELGIETNEINKRGSSISTEPKKMMDDLKI